MHPHFIILIRHGESQLAVEPLILCRVPDHKITLTPKGHQQSLDAGANLHQFLTEQSKIVGVDLLKKIRFIVSPYTRTRQTFAGIIQGLKPKHYDMWEEPRIREQDFGNFQCEDVMNKSKQERSEYGHFFYRFPGGESGADVYDRMSTFFETLHRQFSRSTFPHVVILISHGLTSRLFLMRWFHWSVEEFESLENLRHCEMVIMKRKEYLEEIDEPVGHADGCGGGMAEEELNEQGDPGSVEDRANTPAVDVQLQVKAAEQADEMRTQNAVNDERGVSPSPQNDSLRPASPMSVMSVFSSANEYRPPILKSQDPDCPCEKLPSVMKRHKYEIMSPLRRWREVPRVCFTQH
ncbi:hypothetical protein HDV05_002190 [Chytridiales sp. JEL 0842]|nr:hypothetical protein HDV05_002190 [Chytridiales sp. JEL 0842]